MRALSLILLLALCTLCCGSNIIQPVDVGQCISQVIDSKGYFSFRTDVIGPGIIDISSIGEGTVDCYECCFGLHTSAVCDITVIRLPYTLKLCNTGSCPTVVKYWYESRFIDNLSQAIIWGMIFLFILCLVCCFFYHNKKPDQQEKDTTSNPQIVTPSEGKVSGSIQLATAIPGMHCIPYWSSAPDDSRQFSSKPIPTA